MIRLYELSSKIVTSKVETESKEKEVKKDTKQDISKSFKNTFNFEIPKKTDPKTIEIPATRSKTII